ncbi:MAG: hypothetical protein QOI76_673 [Frankiales bacterium]|nr:hypothetical protein [Frankiales bacterium]
MKRSASLRIGSLTLAAGLGLSACGAASTTGTTAAAVTTAAAAPGGTSASGRTYTASAKDTSGCS